MSDLQLLADCLHLPQTSGAGGTQLLTTLRQMLASRGMERTRRVVAEWDRAAGRVESMFQRLTALEDRGLLHAVYRHAWELKEEMLLLRKYAEWLAAGPKRGEAFKSGEHRPGIYRGGLVAELQQALPMDEAGRFRSASAKLPRRRK